MNDTTRNKFLFNPIFIGCLFLLFLNDHFFKTAFHNWFTGKLSDVVGLIVLTLLLQYLFPKTRFLAPLLAGSLLIFWKLPISQSAIDIYNKIALIKITRIVDYTDLIALVVLPFIQVYVEYIKSSRYNFKLSPKLRPIFILIPASFILIATSPPHYYKYTHSQGQITCRNCSTVVNKSEEEILKILDYNNLKVQLDSTPYSSKSYPEILQDTSRWIQKNNYNFYKIDSLYMENDTLTQFQFSLVPLSDNQTQVYFNGANVSENRLPLSDKKIKRIYRRVLKKYINYGLKYEMD